MALIRTNALFILIATLLASNLHAESIHDACEEVMITSKVNFTSSGASQVEDQRIRDYLLRNDVFNKRVINGMINFILEEGNKNIPTNVSVIYDPKLDPFKVNLETPLASYTILLHDQVELDALQSKSYIHIATRLESGRKTIYIANENDPNDESATRVIALNPRWLIENQHLPATDLSILNTPKNAHIADLESRLEIIEGLIRGVGRADAYFHPMLPIDGYTQFVLTYPQRLSINRGAEVLQKSIEDDLAHGQNDLPIRPVRLANQEPASSGKTVIAAKFIEYILFGRGSHSEIGHYGFSIDQILNLDSKKSLIVFISPVNGIQSDAIKTFQDILHIDTKDTLHIHSNRDTISDLTEHTKLIGISADALAKSDFAAMKAIIAARAGHDKNIILIPDEFHHYANSNTKFAGLFDVVNDAYTKHGKELPTNPKKPNFIMYGMTATTWGNAAARTREVDGTNFILATKFLGYQNLPGDQEHHSSEGKIFGGFLNDQELVRLQRARSLTEVANIARTQTARAGQSGYTSPFRHVEVVNTFNLPQYVQDEIDSLIGQRKLAELKRKAQRDSISYEELVNAERVRTLFNHPSPDDENVMLMDRYIIDRTVDFLKRRHEKNVNDRVLLFAPDIKKAEALAAALQNAVNTDENINSYGHATVKAFHSQSKGNDKYGLEWLSEKIVYRAGNKILHDYSLNTNEHRILIVVNAVDEGVNTRKVNRVGFLYPPAEDESSQAIARQIIQRLNRAGRVSPFKLGTDVLDFSGATRLLTQPFINLTVRPVASKQIVDPVVGIDETTIAVSERSIVTDAEAALDIFGLMSEHRTYDFPSNAEGEFWRIITTNTPFRDVNQDHVSGFAFEVMALLSSLVPYNELESAVNYDRFLKDVTRLTDRLSQLKSRRAFLKSKLTSLVNDCYIPLKKMFDDLVASDELRAEAEASGNQEALAEIESGIVEVKSKIRATWLQIRAVFLELDDYRSSGISFNMAPSEPNISKHHARTALSTLGKFYEHLFQVINESLNLSHSHGVTYGAHGLREIEVSNIQTNDKSAISSFYLSGTNLYSMFHWERGQHKLVGHHEEKDNPQNNRVIAFTTSIVLPSSGLEEIVDGTKSVENISIRDYRLFDNNIAHHGIWFPESNKAKFMKHQNKYFGEDFELDPQARSYLLERVLLGQDQYLRKAVQLMRNQIKAND